MTQKISRSLAAQMITEYEGSQFFSVTFIKKTDGSTREMVCRKGVSKFVKGGSLAYNPTQKGLVGVWGANTDQPEKAYRMINLAGLLSVKMNGNTFEVEGQ
jgi:hypothetical protein